MSPEMKGKCKSIIDLFHDEDIPHFFDKLTETFDWFKNLNEARQIALIIMCLMGWKNLLTLTSALALLATGEYKQAAFEILNSDYIKQLGKKGQDIANMIESGILV